MTPTPDRETRSAAEPIDDLDLRALATLRDACEEIDPVPEGLVDRVTFAMSVAPLEAQIAQIVRESSLASVRGTDYDRADTVTFAGDGVSVMVTIEHTASTRVDIAGWVSEGDVEVELRERGRTRSSRTDTEGRFTFAGVERGLVNFVLRRSDPEASPIITPAIEV